MPRLPIIYTPEMIKDYDMSSPNSKGRWVPVRPMSYSSWRPSDLFRRIARAWGVFTGKYDVLKWTVES